LCAKPDPKPGLFLRQAEQDRHLPADGMANDTGSSALRRANRLSGEPRYTLSRSFSMARTILLTTHRGSSMCRLSPEGAFTGAHRDRMDKFELASGGTVFLDEVTETAPALQAKLLRVLQEGAVARLGAQRAVKVDLRVVAATNRDPQLPVTERVLCQDLFFHLIVVRIDVPPLRERQEDIPPLAEHFLHRYSTELGCPAPALNEEVRCASRRLRAAAGAPASWSSTSRWRRWRGAGSRRPYNADNNKAAARLLGGAASVPCGTRQEIRSMKSS